MRFVVPIKICTVGNYNMKMNCNRIMHKRTSNKLNKSFIFVIDK